MKKGIALVFLLGLMGCNPKWYAHKEAAERSAKAYAEDVLPGYVGVSCVNKDTDGDSYVSCTVKDKDGSIVPLECVGRQFFWQLVKNEGCRVPRMKIAE